MEQCWTKTLTPPIVLFWIICLLINYCTFFPFPSSHFAHVSVLLCLAITPVRISSITEHLSPKLHRLPHSPPSQPLASTLLADTMLLRLFTAHTLPYTTPYWDNTLSFGLLSPEDRTDRLSCNTGKKLPLLAA